MTDQELLDQQAKLQHQAHLVLDELDLISTLSKWGHTQIVGSTTLGLMAWPDIDIETYVNDYNLETMTEIAMHLLSNQNIIDVTLRDYRHDTNPHKPKGLYIGGKYNLQGTRWKMDIWLLKPEHKQAIDITTQMSKITPAQRLAILRIKSFYWNDARYRKSITSIDIYTAVTKHSVTTIKEFDAYLESRS